DAAEPCQIDAGNNYAGHFAPPIAQRVSNIDRGASGDAADLIISERQVLPLDSAPKITPIGDIDPVFQRNGAANDPAVDIGNREVGVVGILAVNLWEKCGASRRIPRA